MALRDLLVYVDQSEGASVRLRLAADLARRHESRLTALFVREFTSAQLYEQGTAELGLASAEGMDRTNWHIHQSINDTEQRLRAALETVKQEYGLKTEWRSLDGVASTVVPQHARYADLCILGQWAPVDTTAVGYTFGEQLLFVIGRPVLFVPALGSFDTLGRHILVAWNSSRPSTRSLNDALPLIERAEQTTVVTLNPTEFIDRHGALPADRMVEHLSRHTTASVQGIQLFKVPAASIADALQAEAHKIGADVIVAGAYGHPMLWEKLLGGVTHDLLARMSLPVMMSH